MCCRLVRLFSQRLFQWSWVFIWGGVGDVTLLRIYIKKERCTRLDTQSWGQCSWSFLYWVRSAASGCGEGLCCASTQLSVVLSLGCSRLLGWNGGPHALLLSDISSHSAAVNNLWCLFLWIGFLWVGDFEGKQSLEKCEQGYKEKPELIPTFSMN